MPSRLHAFTLVEILIVVTILAIAATVAIPSISNGYDSIRVPSAARMVMSDLLYAQNCAITQQQRMFFYLLEDSGNRAYTIAYVEGETQPVSGLTYANVKAEKDCDMTVNGKAVKLLKQPAVQSRYFVCFGPKGGEGPLARTKLSSLKAGSSNITVFGFDSLGQPLKADGTPCLDPIELTFTSLDGGITQKLIVTPITGEISVP